MLCCRRGDLIVLIVTVRVGDLGTYLLLLSISFGKSVRESPSVTEVYRELIESSPGAFLANREGTAPIKRGSERVCERGSSGLAKAL